MNRVFHTKSQLFKLVFTFVDFTEIYSSTQAHYVSKRNQQLKAEKAALGAVRKHSKCVENDEAYSLCNGRYSLPQGIDIFESASCIKTINCNQSFILGLI